MEEKNPVEAILERELRRRKWLDSILAGAWLLFVGGMCIASFIIIFPNGTFIPFLLGVIPALGVIALILGLPVVSAQNAERMNEIKKLLNDKEEANKSE